MQRTVRIAILAVALCAVILPIRLGGEARASAGYDSPYSYAQTFGTALRLLRIDLGCKISEKDPDGGYVLFDYLSPESGTRMHHGTIELVRQNSGTHVTVQLATLPSYHEQMVIDALAKKLATEHGAPPSHPKDPPAPVDAGAEPDAE